VALPLVTPAPLGPRLFVFLGNWTAFCGPHRHQQQVASTRCPVGIDGVPGEFQTEWEMVIDRCQKDF